MNKTARLKALLARGYFPKELPPAFGSSLFARKTAALEKSWSGVVAGMTRRERESHPRSSKPVEFSMARRGHLRRILGIPNPISQYYLSECIATNWSELEGKLLSSPFSITPAKIEEGEGRAVPMVPFSELAERRVKAYAPRRYLLQTDVANFYRAIYTHSIPWALHGKAVAKTQRQRSANLGNELDYLVRQSQDGQTLGIAVGPDTSRIITEILLNAVDKELDAAIPGKVKSGFRYIDDIFYCFDSQADADAALTSLRRIISTYELQLNADKTKISATLEFNEDTWPTRFHSAPISSGKTQGRDLVSFFSNAIEVAKNNPSESIASYAVRMTTGIIVDRKNWDTYSSFLLRLARENANTFDAVSKIIWTYVAIGYPIPEQLGVFINGFIIDTATAKQHFEVSWALWLSRSLNLRLDDATVAVLNELDNAVCALLALHLQDKGLLDAQLDFSTWIPTPSEEALFGEHWLLMYEAGMRGWLGTPANSVISSSSLFAPLLANNVTFFDPAVANRPLQLSNVQGRLRAQVFLKKTNLLPGNVFVPKNKPGVSQDFTERLGSDYGNMWEQHWNDEPPDED